MRKVEDNFESARALLRWAGADLDNLTRSVNRYFAGNPCIEVTELDPETGYYAHKLRFTKRPPQTWRKLTFRVLCDLRHCVDQAMFAAVHSVLGEPPDYDIYFPWAKSPVDLTHRRKKIPEVLWPTLDRLEPYPRGEGHSGGDDTVYAVRNAAGPNKHRIAITPAARPVGFSFEGSAACDWRIPYDGWDAAKNEFTIIDHLTPGAERNYNIKFVLNVAFGEIDGLTGQPVIPALDHFGRYAQFVIIQLLDDAEKIAGL